MGTEEEAPPPAAPPAAASGGWSAIARKDAVPVPKPSVSTSAVRSKSGLSTIVVDTNAVIGSGAHLLGSAGRFVTLREVLEEVRDPMSRMNLAALPIKLEILEPEPEALTKVVQFAKATGDLQSLSEVDMKLIALSYTLEAQAHGVAHLRTRPPPLQVTPVQKGKVRDPPGWGANVTNLKEWEELSEADNKGSKEKTQSKILGLKYLNPDGTEAERAPVAESNQSETTPSTAPKDEKPAPKPKREKPAPKPKPVYNIEGKKNVATGWDASKTEEVEAEEDSSDWVHACSRTTRRKFLKREAKRQAAKAETATSEPSEAQPATTTSEPSEAQPATTTSESSVPSEPLQAQQPAKSFFEADPEPPELLSEDEDAEEGTESGKLGEEEGDSEEDAEDFAAEMAAAHEAEERETSDNPTTDPSWQSSIACATGDFAMQNVILQMGLRLLSPTGIHVRELNRWVLKCTACGKITPEVGRIFCPKCGNGGTLYKVSVTVGANGTVHAGQIKRVNLRGTRYSLPLPKGGRVGAAQNPILREDQLPHRVLHPKQKKSSSNAGGDVYVTADSLFTNNKGGPQNIGLMPAVQQASAVFGGRRNPNERRNNRKH